MVSFETPAKQSARNHLLLLCIPKMCSLSLSRYYGIQVEIYTVVIAAVETKEEQHVVVAPASAGPSALCIIIFR